MRKMDQTELNRWIGEQIYRQRVKREFSQETLAEEANLSRVFISNLENGNCSAKLDTYYRIACALDVSLCELFQEHKAAGAVENVSILLNDCTVQEICALTEILRVSKKQFALLKE